MPGDSNPSQSIGRLHENSGTTIALASRSDVGICAPKISGILLPFAYRKTSALLITARGTVYPLRRHTMFDHIPSQLPLQPFSDEGGADKRPLPERVADGNPDPDTGWPAFPLAYKDVDGKRYYAIQDWIRGVAQSSDTRAASELWRFMKARLKKMGVETRAWCASLNYRASDGKNYKRDHTDGEGLYRITQRMDVNTGLRDRILNDLANSGAFVDGQRIDAIRPPQEVIDEPIAVDPEKLIQAVIAFYRRRGKTDSWI